MPSAPEPDLGSSSRRVLRLTGWAVAANALLLLGAATAPTPVRDVAGRIALWCGLG
ncbi:MAG: hypothetical protein AB7G21_09900 [Dehalococcoidia bacterium]